MIKDEFRYNISKIKLHDISLGFKVFNGIEYGTSYYAIYECIYDNNTGMLNIELIEDCLVLLDTHGYEVGELNFEELSPNDVEKIESLVRDRWFDTY